MNLWSNLLYEYFPHIFPYFRSFPQRRKQILIKTKLNKDLISSNIDEKNTLNIYWNFGIELTCWQRTSNWKTTYIFYLTMGGQWDICCEDKKRLEGSLLGLFCSYLSVSHVLKNVHNCWQKFSDVEWHQENFLHSGNKFSDN